MFRLQQQHLGHNQGSKRGETSCAMGGDVTKLKAEVNAMQEQKK
jgi:hypothetical protein